MVKRDNDPWIIAKRSDMRELLIVVNQRNANLKEINGQTRAPFFSLLTCVSLVSDKVKQIFAIQFSNILLLE